MLRRLSGLCLMVATPLDFFTGRRRIRNAWAKEFLTGPPASSSKPSLKANSLCSNLLQKRRWPNNPSTLHACRGLGAFKLKPRGTTATNSARACLPWVIMQLRRKKLQWGKDPSDKGSPCMNTEKNQLDAIFAKQKLRKFNGCVMWAAKRSKGPWIIFHMGAGADWSIAGPCHALKPFASNATCSTEETAIVTSSETHLFEIFSEWLWPLLIAVLGSGRLPRSVAWMYWLAAPTRRSAPNPLCSCGVGTKGVAHAKWMLVLVEDHPAQFIPCVSAWQAVAKLTQWKKHGQKLYVPCRCMFQSHLACHGQVLNHIDLTCTLLETDAAKCNLGSKPAQCFNAVLPSMIVCWALKPSSFMHAWELSVRMPRARMYQTFHNKSPRQDIGTEASQTDLNEKADARAWCDRRFPSNVVLVGRGARSAHQDKDSVGLAVYHAWSWLDGTQLLLPGCHATGHCQLHRWTDRCIAQNVKLQPVTASAAFPTSYREITHVPDCRCFADMKICKPKAVAWDTNIKGCAGGPGSTFTVLPILT